MSATSTTRQPTLSPPSGDRGAKPSLWTAWPRSAQLALAFLLGLSTALLAVHGLARGRGGAQPAQLIRVAPLDLNQAQHADLLQLPGMGEALVYRLEEYRRSRGGFRQVDELIHVHGIGPATLEKLRPFVCVHAENVELEDASVASSPPVMTRSQPSKKETSLKGTINVNRASVEELQRLPGIGPKLSQRIVDERQKAPFKTVEELRRVPGIGPKTLEKLRPLVSVTSGPVRIAATVEEE